MEIQLRRTTVLAERLQASRAYLARARALLVDAAREPDHRIAAIFFKLGKAFLAVAEELERKVAAELHRPPPPARSH